MTRAEAQKLAADLQAEHVDRTTHRFLARANPDGSWSVAKVSVPDKWRKRPLRTTAEARPRPPYPDDPPGGHESRVPGLPGGLG